MKVLLIVAAAFGAILLFLLATASANTALFARHYPWLIGLNVVVAVPSPPCSSGSCASSGARASAEGLRFAPQVAPDALLRPDGGDSRRADLRRVGPVPHQEHRGWFDVRVEKALESGLACLVAARSMRSWPISWTRRRCRAGGGRLSQPQQRGQLNRMREQAGSETIGLFTQSGQLIGSAASSLVCPHRPRRRRRSCNRCARAGVSAPSKEGPATFPSAYWYPCWRASSGPNRASCSSRMPFRRGRTECRSGAGGYTAITRNCRWRVRA